MAEKETKQERDTVADVHHSIFVYAADLEIRRALVSEEETGEVGDDVGNVHDPVGITVAAGEFTVELLRHERRRREVQKHREKDHDPPPT